MIRDGFPDDPSPAGPERSEEVSQMAEKKITPKAATSTTKSTSETAARVEKKSLKRKKKSRRRTNR